MSGALSQMVRALQRGMRSMGYYDASHPVFEAARNEAFEALQRLWVERDVVTLGGAGAHLIVDADGAVLEDEPARLLALRMFECGVVALRLRLETTAADLGRMLEVLAERPERVRAAGGVHALLTEWGAAGVDVVEVDFGALFAGDRADLGPLVAEDPVAELALKGVLRFREGEGEGRDAVAVDLDRMDDPESLGGFLDELIGEAGPGVVDGGEGFVTADDFADQAAQAYLHGQAKLQGQGAPAKALADSADVLASALVRLSPEARFALLRRLAGGEELSDPEQGAAVEQLGARLDDGLIRSAVAAALVDSASDPDLVRSIGNLVRRLRPVEAKRAALLEDLDRQQAAAGRPIDGVLWQQIQARANDDPGLGLLELAVAEQREGLRTRIVARAREGLEIMSGLDVVHTFARGVVDAWAVRATADLLRDEGRVDDALLEGLPDRIHALAEAGAEPEALSLLQACLHRAARHGGAAQVAARAVLSTAAGGRWSRRLLDDPSLEGPVLAEVLLAALEQDLEAEARAGLIRRLAGLGTKGLLEVSTHELRGDGLRRLASLIEAGFVADDKLGFKFAKSALRNAEDRIKEAALRALARHPSREGISLLAHVAGWRGDRHTQVLLALGGAEASAVARFQGRAVAALGLTRSPLAVRPLLDLLMRSKLFSDAATEELRLGCAQALLTNGTDVAAAALEQAAKEGRRAVKDVVRRVREGRA